MLRQDYKKVSKTSSLDLRSGNRTGYPYIEYIFQRRMMETQSTVLRTNCFQECF